VTDHQWSELAAPYGLGALPPDERERFEAHLAECAACRGEVQALREVAVLLPDAAPVATPPPGLRDRILREARQVRPISHGRAPIVPWLAAAASLVLAVGFGYVYLRERAALQQTSAALAAKTDSLAARDSLIATIFSPDVVTAALSATGKPPSARVFWNQSRRRVVMAVFQLPPAPAGRTYQLWAIAQGKKPVSLGVFNTAADGRLTAAMDVPPGLTFELTAVTEEPAGGSPQPTQQPFLLGKVAPAD
jgi:anti-sigma-K factor RskA